VAKGRENQVNFLPVVAPTAERRRGLDQQDRAALMFTAIDGRPELVGEQPQRRIRL
jgi:hypothetical protein